MAHFAELDENNIVLRVIRVYDEHEADGENWCHNFVGGDWKQTSYNNRIRKNFAGIGFTWDVERDAFIPPKSYDSWLLDEDTCSWEAPVPVPADYDLTKGIQYAWDEANVQWVLVESPELET